MASPGSCEIIEAKPETSKKGYSKNNRALLENDINKLFESLNLRASGSLDLSETLRNASKRPLRASGLHSPTIGFSDPVSLKQALRGLCISQAAEMAAVKRLAMPVSPRMSYSGKIGAVYRSGCLLLEESAVNCVTTAMPRMILGAMAKSAVQSSCSSPVKVKPLSMNVECDCGDSGACSTIVMPHVSAVVEGIESCTIHDVLNPALEMDNEGHKQYEDVSGSNMGNSVPSKDPASVKTLDKSVAKLRRKSRLQTMSSSGVVKANKDSGSTRATSCTVRHVRNRSLAIKRSRKSAVSSDGNLKPSDVVSTDQDHDSDQLLCQRCQCSLRNMSKKSSEALSDNMERDVDKSDTASTVWTSGNMAAKPCEKRDISKSSQSSICDLSSSTASLSDESNLSCSNCSHRPHMSKDERWEAIDGVRKHYGFLGMNHFNLLKKLGSGDIGTVYLAQLIGTNCLFAVKVMDNEFLARRMKIPRAHTEREILRVLDHPFLPSLYAQFTSNNLSCLVMEFCPGGDLHVLRQKQPGRCFPEQAARFYVAEVLLALEYLHMLGIVYRDLKPENILVREDGHIMLTDFDLSLRCSFSPTLVKPSSLGMELPRISGQCAGSNCIDPFCTGPSCQMSCFSPRLIPATAKARKLKADAAAAAQARLLPQLVAEPTEVRSNSFVGTHEYLAPEIIKGEGHGSAVDWWTLGIFLYELLFGRTPFKGAGNEETLANVVLRNLKFPNAPIASFQARDLIRNLLVKEPDHRLGIQTGATEIKRHPFFEGLNWALIRCAIPPQVPELESGDLPVAARAKGMRFLDHTGEGLLFELF